MRSWLLAAVLLLVGALLLSGCSGLPTDGVPQTGRAVDNQDSRPGVVQQPEPPEPGTPMEAVAEGFLRAHIGAAEGFSTAREFLGGSAKKDWDPDQRILLLDSSNLDTRRAAGSRIVVSATAVGEVDATGHLTEFPNLQRRRLDLELKQIDGEWRVTSVPGDLGIWLGVADFRRNYAPHSVYFAARRGLAPATALVPDRRWYPESGLATALARAVIGPPPAWLSKTVRRPVPASTRLQPRTVSVSSRTETATVTLSREALEASPEDRKALWAVMLETLGQVPDVTRVDIRVGKSTLQTAGIGGERSVQKLGYASPTGPKGPMVIREGNRLQWLTTVNKNADRGRPNDQRSDLDSLPVLSGGWSDIAVDVHGREVAAISGDKKQVGRWIGGRLTDLPSFGTQLVRPSFDDQRSLWVAGRATIPPEGSKDASADRAKEEGAPAIWTIDTRTSVSQAKPVRVAAPWLGSRRVLSISVSPGGHRVALVVENRTGRSSVLLSGVVRNESGAVSSLATPVEANPSVQEPTSVTWTTPDTLAVIGKSATTADEQPLVVPLGGLAELLGPIAGATQVVGSSIPQDRVFVVTDRPSIVHRLGRSWDRLGVVEDIAAPAG
ncbi:LpqB family beta-propeller domain-containing protein [Demetria terragena]|uniref:LpqB family beta-propeller domain-containing protein n=1 Tax=Demetria terragena TaxID=63959 RepID=UPI0003A358B4|nr:LpqB family beta-propeller domain-containing protein [Demetria terragena]